jgi:hypothetical protein
MSSPRFEDANVQDPADVWRVQFLHLSERENGPLRRVFVKPHPARLFRFQPPIEILRRAAPFAVCIEARFEDPVNRVVPVVPRPFSAGLEDLPMENSEQPSPNLRAAFESIEGF